MMSKAADNKYNKKKAAIDMVKMVLQWMAVTGLAFLYWMGMLLLLSLFLLNVWQVKFDNILNLSILFTVITSAGYFGLMCYRKFRK